MFSTVLYYQSIIERTRDIGMYWWTKLSLIITAWWRCQGKTRISFWIFHVLTTVIACSSMGWKHLENNLFTSWISLKTHIRSAVECSVGNNICVQPHRQHRSAFIPFRKATVQVIFCKLHVTQWNIHALQGIWFGPSCSISSNYIIKNQCLSFPLVTAES